MASTGASQLAIPATIVLVSFLAYSSQYLFNQIAPGPLSKDEVLLLNVLAICIWVSYARTCLVDPGHVPEDWKPANSVVDTEEQRRSTRQRWCRKCEALKPPRAHHCKKCKRSVDTSKIGYLPLLMLLYCQMYS